MIENITTSQLAKLKQNTSINLIDVREPFEYQYGHIEGAINIPTNEIASNYTKHLNKNEAYYFICQSGSRSNSVCHYLGNLGYNVINVLGGTSFWSYQLVK